MAMGVQHPFEENFHMSYNIDLSGQVALVTGASSGLGAQFAKTLAQAGAMVVLASRRVDKLKDLRAEIEANGGQAHICALDVTSLTSIETAIQTIDAEVGAIDILINNSGVSSTQKLKDVTAKDFDFVFNTNVRGAFFVAQAVGRHMLEKSQEARLAQPHGPKVTGHIINIASTAGLRVLPQIGVYCMSKAAIIHMTKAMALEWGRQGINVNAICPGYIDTEINHHHWETDQGKKLIQMLPRKRVGVPSDLDALVVMLCSGKSHFLNGSIIAADDGFGI